MMKLGSLSLFLFGILLFSSVLRIFEIKTSFMESYDSKLSWKKKYTIVGTHEQPRQIKFHACIRTKNSSRYLTELLAYYLYHGVNSFSIYDNSDDESSHEIIKRFQNAGFVFEYFSWKGRKFREENSALLSCYSKHFVSSDYFMNIDDDEFFFPMNATNAKVTLLAILKENPYPCIAMPIFYFGTEKLNQTTPEQLTVSTFVRRDEDIRDKDYRKIQDKNKNDTLPREFYYYNYEKNNKTLGPIKKRIYKSVYSTKPIKKAHEYLNLLKRYTRHGSLIHGFKMNCTILRNPLIGVAHYTRSIDDLNNRISNFWKDTKRLRHRFESEKKIEAYFHERDRRVQLDMRLVKYDSEIRRFIKRYLD